MIGYRFLGKGRLIQLVIVLVLTTLMVSYVSNVTYGLRTALPSVVGASRNVYVIYDPRSKALFTGLIPLDLAEAVSRVKGVEAVSPEVLIPSLIDGERIAFVRGVSPKEFLKVTQGVKVIDGGWLGDGGVLEAVVGRSLAKELGVGVGEVITASSTISNEVLALKVVGIFRGPEPFNDEVITELRVGQALRGTVRSASFIRVKVTNAEAIKELVRDLGLAGSSGAPEVLKGLPTWILKALTSGRIKVGSGTAVISDYSDAYGLTKSSVTALAIIVLSVGAAAVAMSSAAYASSIRQSIALLLALGASRKKVVKELMIKLTPVTLASSITGYLLAYPLSSLLRLHILLHEVNTYADPCLSAAIMLALTLTPTLTIAHSVRGVMPDEAG